MKNLFTTIFATAALLVANNAWADEDLTPTILTNCNFENNEILFSNTSRVSIGNVEDATTSSHVLQFTSAGNSMNGYTLSTYNFAEAIGTNAAAVKIEFDYNLSKGNASYFRYITIGDGSARDGFARYTYSNAGGVFAFGLARISSQNYFSINGEKNNLENSESNALGTWAHADIYIDLIEKKVSYNISNIEKTETFYTGSNIDFYGTGTYVNQIDYFDCANNVSSYIDNLIITKYTNESAQYANYSVKYVCGENEIKTSASRSGVVGEAASLLSSDTESFFSADNSKKYIYMSDDSADKTISSDGSTVVTVTFKGIGVGNVNVIAKDKEGNTLKTFTETRIEGDDATNLYYTRGIKANDNYYFVAGSFINGVNYGVSMIYGSEDTEIEYALDEDVVYYAEESELNLSRSFAAQGMVPERASGGNWQRLYKNSYAYTSTLNAGTYSIVVAGRNQNSSDGILVIKVRDAEGNILDSYSQELTWAGSSYSAESATNIDVPEGGSIVIANTDETYNSNVGLDYVIVSYATTTYTIKYVNTDNEEIQTAVVDNIYVGETFTASDDQMANIIYQESDYGYLSGNEEKTAVADAEQNVITLVYKKATVTAIDGVKANAEAGAIYTLGGVKVNNPTQGLYIQDGKLIRVK